MTTARRKNLILISILIVVITIFCCLFLRTQIVFADGVFSGGGNGSALAPYIIKNTPDFIKFKEYIEDPINQDFKYFYINAEEIVLPDTFKPIAKPFKGVLNGNGCTVESNGASTIFKTIDKNSQVSNLAIKHTYNKYDGLFAVGIFSVCEKNDGTISQLKIIADIGMMNIEKNQLAMSVAAVCKTNNGTLRDIVVNGEIVGYNAGGICLVNNGSIDRVSFNGTISGITASGIVTTNSSDNSRSAVVSNASVLGIINGGTASGISESNYGRISNVRVSCDIKAYDPHEVSTAIPSNLKYSSAGGIVYNNFGYVSSAKFFNNNILAKNAGGIVINNNLGGQLYNCSVVLDEKYSISGEKVGGIALLNEGDILNVSVSANVLGAKSVGGIAETNKGNVNKAEVVSVLSSNKKIAGTVAGGIVCYNEGKVSNSNLKSVIAGASSGGICATNSATGTVENCLSVGKVISNNAINFIGKIDISGNVDIEINFNDLTSVGCGGIVGVNYGLVNFSINNSLVAIKTDSTDENKLSANLGGITGVNFGKIANCINNSTIGGEAINVGGIAGFNLGEIYNCTVSPYLNFNDNFANITGTFFIGGIVGFNGSSPNLVINSNINIGDINIKSGFNFKITDSVLFNATVTNCVYQSTTAELGLNDIEKSDKIDVDGGVYCGGVCGYLYNGAVSQSVSLGVIGSKQSSKLTKYAFLGGCNDNPININIDGCYYIRYAGSVQFYNDKVFTPSKIKFVKNYWTELGQGSVDNIAEDFADLDFSFIWTQNDVNGFISLAKYPAFKNTIDVQISCIDPKKIDVSNPNELGSILNPIKIYRSADLLNMGESNNKYYKLMADISHNTTLDMFNGTLDGNGYVITFAGDNAFVQNLTGKILNLGVMGNTMVAKNNGIIETSFVNGGRLSADNTNGLIKNSYEIDLTSGNIYTTIGEKLSKCDMADNNSYTMFDFEKIWFRPNSFNNGNLMLRLNKEDSIFKINISLVGGSLATDKNMQDNSIVDVFKGDNLNIDFVVFNGYKSTAQLTYNNFAKEVVVNDKTIVINDILGNGNLEISFDLKINEVGTKLNPILLSKFLDLKKLVVFPNSYFKLVNNIIIKSNTKVSLDTIDLFGGNLDGNGYYIDGLKFANINYLFNTVSANGEISKLGYTNGNNLTNNNLGLIKNCYCVNGLLFNSNNGRVETSYDYTNLGRIFADDIKENLTVKQMNENTISNSFLKTYRLNAGLPILKSPKLKIYEISFVGDNGVTIATESTFKVLKDDDFVFSKEIFTLKEGFKLSNIDTGIYTLIDSENFSINAVSGNLTIKITTAKVATNIVVIILSVVTVLAIATIIILVLVNLKKKKNQH